MSILCNAFKAFWTNFYNTCFRNVEPKIRYSIAIGLIVLSIIFFIFSTKGKNNGQLISNWFWFWISMITLICGILYASL